MATNIGQLVWKITGDASRIKKTFKETDTGAQKLGKILKGVFTGALLAAFAAGVAKIGKEMIGLASDAEETANKFNVVFAGLNDAGDAAENLAEGYGFSKVASQELLSSTADLLQGFGVTKEASLDLSIATQELAADLASFSNKDPIEASKALTSALLGEREAVKQLGIAITDAELIRFAEEQGKVYNEMTKAEKAVLTLELAYKQSANAIGDFERSQASFANQTKIAKAQIDDLGAAIGVKLLPAATEIVTKFNQWIGVVEEFVTNGNFDKVIDGVRILNTVIMGVLNPMGGLIKGIRALSKSGEADADFWEAMNARGAGQLGYLKSVQDQADATAEAVEKQAESAERSALLDLEAEKEIQADAEAERISYLHNLRAEASEKYMSDLVDNMALERELRQEEHEQQLADEEELARVREENKQILLDQASSVYSSMKNVIGAYFDYEISRAEDGSKKQAELKRKQFNIQKGFSAIETGIAGAQAAIEAYKALAGIPYVGPVLGALAAVAVGAMTAVQVGFILAQSPPALASGGVVPASPGGRVVRVAEGGQDEAIVPLDQAGITGGGGSTTLMMDGEVFAKWIQNQINNRGIIVPSGA